MLLKGSQESRESWELSKDPVRLKYWQEHLEIWVWKDQAPLELISTEWTTRSEALHKEEGWKCGERGVELGSPPLPGMWTVCVNRLGQDRGSRTQLGISFAKAVSSSVSLTQGALVVMGMGCLGQLEIPLFFNGTKVDEARQRRTHSLPLQRQEPV